MSFGTNNTTKQAENNLSGTSNLALNTQFPAVTAAGTNLLNTGVNTTAPGVNWLNTILAGNRANTTAALQPNIDQIREGIARTLTAVNTLTPRGGGRTGSNYGLSFAPQGQIQSLFNNARTGAATALPQIGMQEIGAGTNLFGLGNQALGAATGANQPLGSMGLQSQQMSNQLAAQIGAGLFGLATTPFGGGSAKNGLLGLI